MENMKVKEASWKEDRTMVLDEKKYEEDDWDGVATITDGDGKMVKSGLTTDIITVSEAIEYFKSLNLPKVCLSNMNERSKMTELLRWLKNPPRLLDELNTEAALVLSLTQCGLDWGNLLHVRMAQTIYKKLTGANLDCPLRGTHWQLIGFQGSDPRTDLRAVGLFGLLQLLYLVSPDLLPLGRKLYTVANSQDQPFPLAVLSLNVTNIVLNVFNSERMNRECNANGSVFVTLNSFYAAVLNYVLNAWITQKKTIKDSGYLLKDAEKYCGRNIRRVLKDLPNNLKKYDV